MSYSSRTWKYPSLPTPSRQETPVQFLVQGSPLFQFLRLPFGSIKLFLACNNAFTANWANKCQGLIFISQHAKSNHWEMAYKVIKSDLSLHMKSFYKITFRGICFLGICCKNIITKGNSQGISIHPQTGHHDKLQSQANIKESPNRRKEWKEVGSYIVKNQFQLYQAFLTESWCILCLKFLKQGKLTNKIHNICEKCKAAAASLIPILENSKKVELEVADMGNREL